MRRKSRNYSADASTEENMNYDDKYVVSGESSWSRDLTVPFDDNEVLVERHYQPMRGQVSYTAPDERDRSYLSAGLGWGRSPLDREDFTGVGPKGYVPSDERIKEEVSDALFLSTKVDATDIEVDVEDGIVYLNGSVESRVMKRQAEDLIYGLPWVIDVQNRLRVVRKNVGPLVQNRTGMI